MTLTKALRRGKIEIDETKIIIDFICKIQIRRRIDVPYSASSSLRYFIFNE